MSVKSKCFITSHYAIGVLIDVNIKTSLWLTFCFYLWSHILQEGKKNIAYIFFLYSLSQNWKEYCACSDFLTWIFPITIVTNVINTHCGIIFCILFLKVEWQIPRQHFLVQNILGRRLESRGDLKEACRRCGKKPWAMWHHVN